MADIAAPLPLYVICELLGAPAETRPAGPAAAVPARRDRSHMTYRESR
ncbi:MULTISPECIES: hypothetical protein [Streptosporangium]|uniref:Cytochrome P450 n=1 Tax=Streptosporangium brasiliense TaxID=47480 RepID=A0ABT9R024_9ACTN|nr:hypothetical protein [Streptosporangium brasiliense]MDP9862192.1 cytochrome P450 [Streptosporangium brasiliense]